MNFTNRLYLDHNATAPLSKTVRDQLMAMPSGNPSSVHGSGKSAKRHINQVRKFLYSTYNLSENKFDLFFHSGATEGINSFIKGHALKALEEKKTMTFFALGTDHSCVVNQKKFLELLGHRFVCLPTDSHGAIKREESLALIKENKGDINILNWTWVNNETGIVHKLEDALEWQKHGLMIHVDAVQATGKIAHWQNLNSEIESYTFSGHKFGSLKGIGFTFIKTGLDGHALLNGGGQQSGLRSGTENTYGIFSLKLALDDLMENYSYKDQVEGKEWFEEQLSKHLVGKGHIVGADSPRNGSTIYFMFDTIEAQRAAMVFDMAGIDLSNGSACSSGAVVPSRVLLVMGYDETQAKSALRVSFPWCLNGEMAKEVWERFEGPLSRLLEN